MFIGLDLQVPSLDTALGRQLSSKNAVSSKSRGQISDLGTISHRQKIREND